MHLSLRAKLVLALACVGLLVVLATQGFVRWSLLRGMEQLAAEREQGRIDAIALRLLAIHARDGGWQRLAADKRQWVRVLLLRGDDEPLWPGEHRRRPPRGDDPDALAGPRPPPASPPPWLRQALEGRLGEPGVWPPTRALARLGAGETPAPLELRLMLLDAAGGLIYGRPELLATASRRPLRVDGETIGSLALLPGPSVADLADQRFRDRQTLALWLIALGLSLASALVAFPLAARLTRPVAALQQTVQRLAAGDYAARVAASGDDALGRLARDLNALAGALAQHADARRRWVADISHELRTPLALLRAEIEALQDGVREVTPASLARLHADTLRLGRLVDDLYELSMTDLGALSYRKAPLDLALLLDAEIDAFRAPFAAAGLGLDLGLGLGLETAPHGAGAAAVGRPWRVHGDPERLAQLVRNLLRNSLRYTDAGGRLQVTLTRDGGRLLLDFDDTAPGVPAAALPRLFDRLYRVDASRSRATGGAGLGLAIARNIVLAHGGTIEAAPSPLGGLRIRIRLPADDARAETGSGTASEPGSDQEPKPAPARAPAPDHATGTRR